MYEMEPCRDYLIAFTSFYQSMYAKDRLREKGISAVPQRVPAAEFKTCSQGLRVRGADADNIKRILDENSITIKGMYVMDQKDGKLRSKKL